MNRSELVPLIRDVCLDVVKHAKVSEVQLLLGTAAVESNFVYRRQIGGGPAVGLWQMETDTARDIFDNYLRYRYLRYCDVMGLRCANWDKSFRLPRRWWLWWVLQRNDRFACGMARVHYLRVPAAIPDTVEEQAQYWKEFYNTSAGAGTVDKYMTAWRSLNCYGLMAEHIDGLT